MNTKKPNHGVVRCRPAFTLVELMIVIVIVAVLATLAFSGARKLSDEASKAKTVANMKQLSTVFHQCSTDRNGALLHWDRTSMDVGGVTATRNWSHYLLLTLSPDLANGENFKKTAGDIFARETQLFADPKALKAGAAQGNFAKKGHDSWRTYAYNNRIGLPKVASSGEIPYAVGAKYDHQVSAPSRLVLFSQRVLESHGVYFSFLQPEDGSNNKIYFDLYKGSALVGHYDGSVTLYKKKEFPSWGGISQRTGKPYTNKDMDEFWFGSHPAYPAP